MSQTHFHLRNTSFGLVMVSGRISVEVKTLRLNTSYAPSSQVTRAVSGAPIVQKPYDPLP